MIKVTEEMLEAADEVMPENLKGLYFQVDLKQAITAAIEASEEIQELIKCQECLKELLYLKMYKEKKGGDKFYKDNKNIAWHNAKKLMIKADIQPPKEQNND